ncbi:MAG: hypothetical protein ACR2Q3_15585 [Woeseiaceae bacterium]
MDRRLFTRGLAAAGVIASCWRVTRANDDVLVPTPRDYEGPYYPEGPRNQTNDLIVGDVRDRVLNFSGKIVAVDGEPRTNVVFDFWQADPLGRYLHPRDKSRGERWSDFLYWGEVVTDEVGEFTLRTYVPGEYGRRPPHIHYKVRQGSKTLLTSQVYFSEFGGPRNAARSSSAMARQTVDLRSDTGESVAAHFQVIV